MFATSQAPKEIERPRDTEPNVEPFPEDSSPPAPAPAPFDPTAIDVVTAALRESVERLRIRVRAHRREVGP